MDVRRIKEEVDPDFFSDAHSRTGPAKLGDSCESKYKAEKVCHEEMVKMPLVDLKVLEVRGKRTNVNARSYRSTKREVEFRIELVRGATPIAKSVSFNVYGDERVVGIVARAASEFHERNESGVLAIFRQVVIMFKRRHLGLHEALGGARVAFEDEFGAAEEREVSCEAQQGQSRVKRKLFGSCRNNMGNEPILALPEGSDNFVVMRGARVRMLA
ncbi:hypothetical protein Tco_1236049 [Tanacetum coccineum]